MGKSGQKVNYESKSSQMAQYMMLSDLNWVYAVVRGLVNYLNSCQRFSKKKNGSLPDPCLFISNRSKEGWVMNKGNEWA